MGKEQERGGEQTHRGAHRDRPVTTIWALARPAPALLTAVHSYAPASALEARGISQLLFPDSLRTQNSRRHAITLNPVGVPHPYLAFRGLGSLNLAQRRGPRSSWTR